MHTNNNNGTEQHTTSENGDCEYLELQHSPVGDDTKPDYANIHGVELQHSPVYDDAKPDYVNIHGAEQHSPVYDNSKPDYVNILGVESPSTSKAETVTNVKLEEGSHQTKLSTVNIPFSPKNSAPSDDSDLPDYVNVFAPSSEIHLPPPIPPRNK
jgi:hypothetical protein